MAACNLCGDPVIWGKTESKGAGVPLNAQPDPRGSAWFIGTGKDRRVRVASEAHPKPEGERFFRLHFLGCRVYLAKKRLERALKEDREADTDATSDQADEAHSDEAQLFDTAEG